MNPWRQSILEGIQTVLRLALWVAICLHGLMFSVFSILITFKLLTHAYRWLNRVLFQGDW